MAGETEAAGKHRRKRRPLWKRVLLRLVVYGLGGLAALCFIAAWGICHPERRTGNMPAQLGSASQPLKESELTDSGAGDPIVIYLYRSTQPNARGVLLFCHTWSYNAANALDRCRFLSAEGFHVVLFDLPGHGKSGGTCTFGLRESRLLLPALVKWIREKFPDEPLVLWGDSIGAVMAVAGVSHVSGEVSAVIAENPFRSLPACMGRHINSWLGLPAFPANYLVTCFVGVLSRSNPFALSLEDEVAQPGPPILLLSSEGDPEVQPDTPGRLVAAGKGRVKLRPIPGAGHMDAFPTGGRELQKDILTFLDEVLPSTPD